MGVSAIAHLEPPPDHGSEATRLFEAHSEWLHRYCLRQLGSPADAEDAVQTTFLHALRALQRDVAPECEEAWLTVIAKNVCHTHRRTLGRRGAFASDVDLDAIAARPTDDCDEDRLIGLRDALSSLPESQRRALVLREWHGVPSQEIAAQLHLSTPATHALLSRARRSLARALTIPRPVAGFDLSWLLSKLEAPLRLLGHGMSKATAVAVAAGVIAGGSALEREMSSPSRADRVPAPVVQPTGQSPSNSGSGSGPSAAQPTTEEVRAGGVERRGVTSPTARERTATVSGPAAPEIAPSVAPAADSPQPRQAAPPEAEAPAPAPAAPIAPPPILEPPSVPEPEVPVVDPTGLLPPLPLPPLPDPLADPPAVPAPPETGLPIP